MKKLTVPSRKYHFLIAFTALVMGACAPQNIPSMMNESKPQLNNETHLSQVAIAKVNAGYIRALAEDYRRFGADSMHLGLVYDPHSRQYTAMKAFEDLARIKDQLAKNGVRDVRAETIKIEGSEPVLMVTYDTVHATAPENCSLLPGLDNNVTTRFIGDYKFGCSVDTMLANQIYRPADLAGNDQFDPGDGRRAANVTEYYRQVQEENVTGDLVILDRREVTN